MEFKKDIIKTQPWCLRCDTFGEFETTTEIRKVAVKGVPVEFEAIKAYCPKCGDPIFVYEVERINQYLPTKNMRGGILYRTSLKYCDRVMKNPEKFKGDRNFLVYSQIETYLDEIYDEYYNTKKR